MKVLISVASLLGLILVIGAPLWYLFGSIDKESVKGLMLVGTVIWFVTVPFWMGRKKG